MPTDKGRTYRVYNCFRRDLERASTETEVLNVFANLLPSFNTDTAAIVVQPQMRQPEARQSRMHQQCLLLGPQIGERSLWTEYRSLCPSDQQPLSRLLRLCTYPVALSEIQHHANLHKRLQILHILLIKQGYNDALVVPLFDQQSRNSAMIFAGRDLPQLPSKRHWMIQTATDIAARIAAIREVAGAYHRDSLTVRQLEVAPWLVEGKSDWEIGKILEISAKTVNYHVENMKRTYGVKTRNQFVAAFIYRGGFKPDAGGQLFHRKVNPSST
jgi:DNA-binding CsgD family transcriptional regulator